MFLLCFYSATYGFIQFTVRKLCFDPLDAVYIRAVIYKSQFDEYVKTNQEFALFDAAIDRRIRIKSACVGIPACGSSFPYRSVNGA